MANEIEGFSEQSIRWHIFNAQTNGLAEIGAIKRIGRRVLIDADLFHQWIDNQQIAGPRLGSTRKIAQAAAEGGNRYGTAT